MKEVAVLKTEHDLNPLQRRLRRVLYAASLLCALAAPAAHGQQAKSSLAGDITAGLQEEGLSGAVWTELQPDGKTVTDAAALKNAATAAPMQADSKVQVGSVAKVVLALGVLHLVSEGKLTLDTPLYQVLPQLALKNPWQASDPVRIRH